METARAEAANGSRNARDRVRHRARKGINRREDGGVLLLEVRLGKSNDCAAGGLLTHDQNSRVVRLRRSPSFGGWSGVRLVRARSGFGNQTRRTQPSVPWEPARCPPFPFPGGTSQRPPSSLEQGTSPVPAFSVSVNQRNARRHPFNKTPAPETSTRNQSPRITGDYEAQVSSARSA